MKIIWVVTSTSKYDMRWYKIIFFYLIFIGQKIFLFKKLGP